MRCTEKGCKVIQACFNFPDQTRGIYCQRHASLGMINVLDKRRWCRETDCRVRAYFNFPEEKNGIYCQTHCKPGMVSVRPKQKKKKRSLRNIQIIGLYYDVETFDALYHYVLRYVKKIPKTTSRPNAAGIMKIEKNVLKNGSQAGQTKIKKVGYPVQSITLGKTMLRNAPKHMIEDQSQRPVNIRYQHFINVLKHFMKIHQPEWKFTSISINHNFQTKPHKDGQNVGHSIIFAIGDYTGGELCVEGQLHDIKHKFVKFNGSEKEHWTNEFEGDRWSFVFYNLNR